MPSPGVFLDPKVDLNQRIATALARFESAEQSGDVAMMELYAELIATLTLESQKQKDGAQSPTVPTPVEVEVNEGVRATSKHSRDGNTKKATAASTSKAKDSVEEDRPRKQERETRKRGREPEGGIQSPLALARSTVPSSATVTSNTGRVPVQAREIASPSKQNKSSETLALNSAFTTGGEPQRVVEQDKLDIVQGPAAGKSSVELSLSPNEGVRTPPTPLLELLGGTKDRLYRALRVITASTGGGSQMKRSNTGSTRAGFTSNAARNFDERVVQLQAQPCGVMGRDEISLSRVLALTSTVSRLPQEVDPDVGLVWSLAHNSERFEDLFARLERQVKSVIVPSGQNLALESFLV
jgi:hypothetical protein